MSRTLVLAFGIAALAITAGGLALRAHAEPPTIEIADPPAPIATPVPLLVVDVVGAIAHPGIVRLPHGSRVLDALLAAGGMTGDADLFALNKAELLRDGMRIYVPRPGESVPAGSLGSAAERKVNVNDAAIGELTSLPGVGPTTAARIVRSREQHPFAKVDELQTRGLVPPRVFADIRDLVTVK